VLAGGDICAQLIAARLRFIIRADCSHKGRRDQWNHLLTKFQSLLDLDLISWGCIFAKDLLDHQ